MLCEEVRGGGVTANLHFAKLIELPAVQIGGSGGHLAIVVIVGQLVNSPDKADMYPHISMYTRTFQTDVNAERDARPCRVASGAVETTL